MKTMPRSHRRPPTASAMALLTAAALVAAGCAGEVGKYRNALPAAGVASAGQAGDITAAVVESPGESADGQQPGVGAATPGSEVATGQRATGSTTGAGAGRAAPAADRAARAGTTALAPRTTTTSGPAGDGRQAAGPPSGSGVTAQQNGGGGTASTSPSGAPPVPAEPGITTGVTRDTITIGLFYSKTGAYSALARNAPTALQAAFAEAGPIHGRKLVLKTYDDGTANAGTIQVEEKRAKDEAFALISGVGESNVVLAPLADQHKVPLLAGNIDDQVALKLTYVFPLWAYWAHQARLLPGFV